MSVPEQPYTLDRDIRYKSIAELRAQIEVFRPIFAVASKYLSRRRGRGNPEWITKGCGKGDFHGMLLGAETKNSYLPKY